MIVLEKKENNKKAHITTEKSSSWRNALRLEQLFTHLAVFPMSAREALNCSIAQCLQINRKKMKIKLCIANFGCFAKILNAPYVWKAEESDSMNVFFFLSLQENVMISQKNNLSDYYKSLRNNVITLLEQSRRPNDPSNEMKQQERVEAFAPKL